MLDSSPSTTHRKSVFARAITARGRIRAARAVAVGCALAAGALMATGQAAMANGSAQCDGSALSDGAVISNVMEGDLFESTGNATVDIGFSTRPLHSWNSTTYTATAVDAGRIAFIATESEFVRVTCTRTAVQTPPAGPTDDPTATTTAAQDSVTVQARVTQTAINTNVAGRFGGSGISANSNGITVSTRGLDTAISDMGEPELNAWIGIEGRQYSGVTTGDSRNLSFGIDRLVNPNLVIGGFISYNDQTATVGGATTTTKSPIFGAYAASKLNNGLFVSGFVGYGRPKYSTDTDNFTATRQVLGLSMSGQMEAGALRLTPLANVLASREDLPAVGGTGADSLKNVQATLSVRAEPLQRLANGMLPYISLGAEYRRQGSDLAGYDTFTKPRLGIGADWQLAAGNLRFDVDYGSLNSNSKDLGASLIYDFKF